MREARTLGADAPVEQLDQAWFPCQESRPPTLFIRADASFGLKDRSYAGLPDLLLTLEKQATDLAPQKLEM